MNKARPISHSKGFIRGGGGGGGGGGRQGTSPTPFKNPPFKSAQVLKGMSSIDTCCSKKMHITIFNTGVTALHVQGFIQDFF